MPFLDRHQESYTDLYELTMAQEELAAHLHDPISADKITSLTGLSEFEREV